MNFGFKFGLGEHPVTGLKTHPNVLLSEVFPNNPKRIVVEWDRAMKGTTDIRFAIFITVDGAAPILPETVIFSENAGKFYMMLVMTVDVLPGQVIDWAYDDSTTSERLSSVVGDMVAIGSSHHVDNKLPSVSEFGPGYNDAFN